MESVPRTGGPRRERPAREAPAAPAKKGSAGRRIALIAVGLTLILGVALIPLFACGACDASGSRSRTEYVFGSYRGTSAGCGSCKASGKVSLFTKLFAPR